MNTAAAVQGHDQPETRLQLGAFHYAEDRLDDARTEWEAAFRGFQAAGALPQAARVASLLGELHWGSLGNAATGRGWIERGRRLLEQAGPCVEWGYWELAMMACERPDADDLLASAERAMAIAAEYGDTALHVRALTDGGLALVTQGRVREGFSRLDEALAALTSGEVDDPWVVGTAFCSLLSSCDRAGDVERANEWIRVVRRVVLEPTGDRPRVLRTHCSVALGGVLCTAGRWPEAEEALLDALGPSATSSTGHRTDALARLAELRLQQGRVDEAAELLAPIEDSVSAAGPLAAVHLHRGEPARAAAVLRRTVKQLVGDVLRAAPLLGTLVEAELLRGDLAAARDAAGRLHAMAQQVDTPAVSGLAILADAHVLMAEGRADEAIEAFDTALARFTTGERPVLVAVTHLDLAEAYEATGDTDAAVTSARAAHAAATRLSATTIGDRAGALLRRLGATPPRAGASSAASNETIGGLTAREHEVLDGLRRGDSNAEIAGRLYLSPKTVEHHVSRVLAKLGVRTRAEAAAVAAAASVLAPDSTEPR